MSALSVASFLCIFAKADANLMAKYEPDCRPLNRCTVAARNVAYLEEDAQVVALLAQLQQRHRPFVWRVLRLVHAVGAV